MFVCDQCGQKVGTGQYVQAAERLNMGTMKDYLNTLSEFQLRLLMGMVDLAQYDNYGTRAKAEKG